MSVLDPRIRAFFPKDDEFPEKSWDELNALDQAWLRRIGLAGGSDPGVLSYEQWQRLGGDDRQRRLRRLEDWYAAWPFVRTTQVGEIARHLETLPKPDPENHFSLLDVPVITGRPGTGKTAAMMREAATALGESAMNRRLRPRDTNDGDPLIAPDWRPVIFHSTDGNPRVKAFFAQLCEEIGVPPTSEPQAAFQRAVKRHGVRYVFIDEVQMINFDGQYGMYLHNAIKAIQNTNVRIVLAGHNVRHMLGRRQTAAQNATQTQTTARWAFQDLTRYEHDTAAHVTEWRGLLRELEKHLRLAGHEPGETVLSVEFEEHLWVSTLGYINSLAALLTGACLTASRTKAQRITPKIIDSIRLNERASRGRERRLKDWKSRSFNWATDAADLT